jgi:hypothetical protein
MTCILDFGNGVQQEWHQLASVLLCALVFFVLFECKSECIIDQHVGRTVIFAKLRIFTIAETPHILLVGSSASYLQISRAGSSEGLPLCH